MRKGKSLLSLAAMVAAAVVCLLYQGAARADTLEPTDSGAPSAIVIFPVGEKPNPAAAGMAPVAYNHVIHEKWMNRTGTDCMVCHHTGDPVACTECHTVEGKAEGKFYTLQQVMHTPKVRQRKENTPSSCVSCHKEQTKQRDCAGCHTQLVQTRDDDPNWCRVCHTITPSMTRAQMQKGIANTLSARQNEVLATETALARKPVSYWSPLMAPYKVSIDSLKGQYEAALFNHRHHAFSLADRISTNRLAGAFHTSQGTICVTCHHNSPASTTPPKCLNCHSADLKRMSPGRPALMAAFHLQCMNCHKDMKVGRPRSTDCATCHKIAPTAARTTQGE